MILMDRENAMAPGWSHAHSDAPTHDGQVAELEAFRKRVGAPPSALQYGSWIHLDIMRAPRRKALAMEGDEVRVFEPSRDLVVYLRGHVLRGPASRAA
jgi:hypothetical protein